MKKINFKQLQKVLDALQDGVYITDGNGRTVTVNKAYERITGIQKHKVAGRHMADLVKAGFISKSASLEVIRERQPVTLVQTIHDKRKIFVSATPMFDDHGELTQVITSVRDITELVRAKHAEEQLQQMLSMRKLYAGVPQQTDDNLLISPATHDCYQLAARVARRNVKLLIQGETGTGKTHLARFVHQQSERAAQPFMELNCAAMPEGLLESELFGYVGGAFTGASKQGKKGLLEVARGGTLLLDEVGDLPLALQAKLLKVVDENQFLPVGGTEFIKLDVRLICATHYNLHDRVEQGLFREDLFYRLSVVPLQLPPLRQRQEDIIALLQHYLPRFNQQHEQKCQWQPETLELLSQYTWPGNIRELINLTERLVVSCAQPNIDISDLPAYITGASHSVTPPSYSSLPQQVASLERRLIEAALAEQGTTRAAAAALGIDQSTLVKKKQRWQQQKNTGSSQ
ncbi:hypothetical protein CWE09_12920 [Aliidiomarina minuta]|uniref:Transcriptional regulatory protein TyrR n=1 Tax=Aliidiomarina minuta TaxID=880057 RepID=A0A432W3W2_9GAMM|nr:sigma 54-interacting transcriptional regulator [Aliidiomarina minuta]RUO24040.1 hypothetical protein CWE09_12920 [Aliidiomarina minuta]